MSLRKTLKRLMYKPGFGYMGTLSDDLSENDLRELSRKMMPHILNPKLLFRRKATRFKTAGLRFTIIPFNGLGWVSVVFLPLVVFHEWLHFVIFASTGKKLLGTIVPGVLDTSIAALSAVAVFYLHQLWALYFFIPCTMMALSHAVDGDFWSAWKLWRQREP